VRAVPAASKALLGQTAPAGSAVLTDVNHKLVTLTSSKGSKENIKPVDTAIEALSALKLCALHYKKKIDPGGYRSSEGKLNTVAMTRLTQCSLTSFLKEHRTQTSAFVTVKKGIHRVWIPAFTGSHLPGRWLKVDDTGAWAADDTGAWAAEATGNNIVRISGEELHRTIHSLDIKEASNPTWSVPGHTPGALRLKARLSMRANLTINPPSYHRSRTCFSFASRRYRTRS
jgi:hypothetical protein